MNDFNDLLNDASEDDNVAKVYSDTNAAVGLLEDYVRAYRLLNQCLPNYGIYTLGVKTEFQVWNLIKWCELLGIDYEREDWEGNENCKTNWDIVYFTYCGLKFFELVRKEK